MTQELRFPGTPKSVIISREGEDWFASVQVELSESYVYPNRCKTQASVGIDLGIKTLATMSDGTKVRNPSATKKYATKLARAQRGLARKLKGSRNRARAKLQVSKIHLRIKRIRQDSIHKMTAKVVRNFEWIGRPQAHDAAKRPGRWQSSMKQESKQNSHAVNSLELVV